MPTYIWEDENTGRVFEVFRTFDDYKVPPSASEMEADMTEAEFGAARWFKLIKHPRDLKVRTVYIRPTGKGFNTPGNWGK